MKVVIDTNVFISSFFGGNPQEVIQLWRNQTVTLCLSDTVLDEYIEVLQRLELNEQLIAELVGLFSSQYNLLFTKKTPSIKAVQQDPDDDKFVECAIALEARYIISGDKALLSLGNYQQNRIVTPAAFLDLIQNS